MLYLEIVMEYRLRPATESDRRFLYELHYLTMHALFSEVWGWDEDWQRKDFNKRFAAQHVSVIEIDREAAGSLWMEPKPDSIYVSMLQVTPAAQGRGIGSSVLQTVAKEAAGSGLSVTLSVLQANPRARALYERLGFEVTAIDPPFVMMRRPYKPSTKA